MFLWDVFNETVAGGGQGFRNRQHKEQGSDEIAPYGYSYSPWVDGSDVSLIRAAFVKARQTDPNAKLFLNDYDNDQLGQPKAETFYRLVTDLKQAGVPIDGVGFQMRVSINGDTLGTWTQRQKIDTYLADIDKSVKRYADLGLLVEFSEVEVGIRIDDMDLSTPAGQKPTNSDWRRRQRCMAAWRRSRSRTRMCRRSLSGWFRTAINRMRLRPDTEIHLFSTRSTSPSRLTMPCSMS